MNGQVIYNLIFDCESEREDKLTQFYTSMKQYKSSSRVVKGTNWAGQIRFCVHGLHRTLNCVLFITRGTIQRRNRRDVSFLPGLYKFQQLSRSLEAKRLSVTTEEINGCTQVRFITTITRYSIEQVSFHSIITTAEINGVSNSYNHYLIKQVPFHCDKSLY